MKSIELMLIVRDGKDDEGRVFARKFEVTGDSQGLTKDILTVLRNTLLRVFMEESQ